MDDPIFPISGVNTPQESHFNPFDLDYVYNFEPNTDTIPLYSETYIPNIHSKEYSAEVSKLKNLVADFSKGFDAKIFPDYVKDWIPRLSENLFPGSYAHLLIILLGNWDMMEHSQFQLFQWLCERHRLPKGFQPGEPSESDKKLFTLELKTLRQLLAPLRGDDLRPVHWIGSRIANPGDSCAQVEAMMKVIRNFKEELVAEVWGANDDRTIYNTRGPNFNQNVEISVREFRMSACRATLGWNDYLENTLQNSFFQYTSVYTVKRAPDHARAFGFLPPRQPAIPPYTPVDTDGETVAWCNWPQPEYQNSILDLVLKLAVWLGLARGSPVMHLFCDIVRAFSLKPPSATTDLDRIALLYHFASLRVSCENEESPEDDIIGLNDPDKEVRMVYHLGDNPSREMDLAEIDTIITNYQEHAPGTQHFKQVPPIILRTKFLRKVNLFYDRKAVAALYHLSLDTTLSSKLAPVKCKPEDFENNNAHGKKRSRPIPIPGCHGAPAIRTRSASV